VKLGPRKKTKNKPKKKKMMVSSEKKWIVMNPFDVERKTQFIQWTKRPTGAMVAVRSL